MWEENNSDCVRFCCLNNCIQNLSDIQHHLLFSLAGLRFAWGLSDPRWAGPGSAPGCRLVLGLLWVSQSEPNNYGALFFSWWIMEVDKAKTNFWAHLNPLLASNLLTFISQSSRYGAKKTCPPSSMERLHKGPGWILYYRDRMKNREQEYNPPCAKTSSQERT